jgi:hypothetical protein
MLSKIVLNAWDANGRPIVRSDSPPNTRATVADRPYFREQRERDIGVGISKILVGRQTGKELMNLTVRRPASDGSFRGAVAASIHPAFFRDFYRSLVADDPRLAGFLLVRNDGELLARWPATTHGGEITSFSENGSNDVAWPSFARCRTTPSPWWPASAAARC